MAEPPTLTRLFPGGGCAGTIVPVTATGKFTTWPVQVDCSPAKLQWKPLEENGKFEVTIPTDAPSQIYLVRFYTADGSSDLRRFMVDDVPLLTEIEPNNLLKAANAIDSLPKQVYGVLQKGGDVDTYRLELAAGSTLVATLDAQHWLRSPLDAVLQLADDRGNVVAENIDTHNLDPQVVHTVKRAGSYVLRVMGFPESPDSTISFVGNDNCQYRLTVTTGGHVEGGLPLAIQTNVETTILPRGYGLMPDLAPWKKTGDSQVTNIHLNHPLATGLLSIPVVNHGVVSEPIAADAPPISPPITLCGVISERKQIDSWPLQIEKDKSYRIEVESHQLGYALDPVVRLINADGKEVHKVDETSNERDPNFTWKGTASGVFQLRISDAEGEGGNHYFYRATIKPVEPFVKIIGPSDHAEGETGKPLEIKLTVERLDGFTDPLDVELIPDPAHPLPAECTISTTVSEKEGESAKELKWTIQSTVPFSQPIRLQVRSKMDPNRTFSVSFGAEKASNLWLTLTPPK